MFYCVWKTAWISFGDIYKSKPVLAKSCRLEMFSEEQIHSESVTEICLLTVALLWGFYEICDSYQTLMTEKSYQVLKKQKQNEYKISILS